MELIDFIKQFAQVVDNNLKRRHLAVLSAILVVSLIFSTPNAEDDSNNSLPFLPLNAELSTATPNDTAGSIIKNSSLSLPSTPFTNASQEINSTSPWFSIEVESGDNLSLIFARANLTPQDVFNISNSGDDASILSNLYPGYTLNFDISKEGELNQLEVIKTPLESILFIRTNKSNFVSRHLLRSPNIEHTFKEAVIRDSLFLAAQKGGISDPITMEIAGIFGGVIDFLLDTRENDSFNVLYEEEYLDGDFIGNGAILAAQFTNQGKAFTAVRYISPDGQADYFNLQGESMSKAFLLNPIDYVRISDGFNLARKHPILNTIRAHRGTDYAAPRGTEIVATSDGVVTWAARNGSFGKLITIQHGEKFETKYAHLSDYANGIKKGSKVTQGQIIGYVGTTGNSTGPHLHYEFLMDGVHRNSRTIFDELPKAESIPNNQMSLFHAQTDQILAKLQSYTHGSVAAVIQTFD